MTFDSFFNCFYILNQTNPFLGTFSFESRTSIGFLSMGTSCSRALKFILNGIKWKLVLRLFHKLNETKKERIVCGKNPSFGTCFLSKEILVFGVFVLQFQNNCNKLMCSKGRIKKKFFSI